MSEGNRTTERRRHASERALTAEQAESLGRRYVAAYNDRDLEAMLTLQDPDVVSYPSRLFESRGHHGHVGVRKWWAEMVRSGRWYTVKVREVRLLSPDRFAVFGELYDGGELLSPWGVVVRVRDGLIVESHSYLSGEDLLEELEIL